MLTNLVIIRTVYKAMQRDGRWETNDACTETIVLFPRLSRLFRPEHW